MGLVPHTASASDRSASPHVRARETRLLALLIVVVLGLAALAYHAVSRDDHDDAPGIAELPGGRIDYLLEGPAPLTLSDVATGAAASRFEPLTESVTGGELRGPYWLRLDVPNPASHAVSVVLEFADLYVDEATLYAPPVDSDGLPPPPPARTGQRVPLVERSVRSHLPAVHVTLPPGGARIFIHSAGEIERPSTVRRWGSAEAFRRYEQRQMLPLMLYLGLWAALLTYNGFVFAVLRERVILRYLCYLAAVGGLALIGTNASAYFFAGPSGIGREVCIFALLALSSAALVQFSRAFLETARLAPRLERGLRVLFWVNAAVLLGTPLLFNEAIILRAGPLLYQLAVATLAALPLAGIYLWIRGCRQAPLYVLAFGCFTAGLVWMILAQIGVVPPDHTNGAPFLIGSGLELLLLSIAVAYRYRLMRDEKERLQATYATQLETDVATRTRELHAANADKDRLISIIAHDVRSPLTSLLAVSRSLARDPSRRPPEEVSGDARAIQQRCGDLLSLVDNLLDWARLRTGHLTRAPAELNLAGLAEAAARPLQAAANAKSLRLELTVAADFAVYADGYAVQCVLRNLLANAIKFTPAGGTISVDAAARDGVVEARVTDTGVGIAPERLAALLRSAGAGSEAGTAGETGAGIGLALCRELIEREGGTLQLESNPGRGAIARVTLPAVSES